MNWEHPENCNPSPRAEKSVITWQWQRRELGSELLSTIEEFYIDCLMQPICVTGVSLSVCNVCSADSAEWFQKRGFGGTFEDYSKKLPDRSCDWMDDNEKPVDEEDEKDEEDEENEEDDDDGP
eukprot:1630343-Rhodomonas_salina.1